MIKKKGSISNSFESPEAEEELGAHVLEFKYLAVSYFQFFPCFLHQSLLKSSQEVMAKPELWYTN